MSAVADYLRAVRRTHGGAPTEHSYRPDLQALLEALRPGAVVTNEPRHSRRFGAVDMRVTTGAGPEALTIGYVECKDIGAALDEIERSEQLKRYRDNLPSLVLTDYLEFRWYVEGAERDHATLRVRRTYPASLPPHRGGPCWCESGSVLLWLPVRDAV